LLTVRSWQHGGLLMSGAVLAVHVNPLHGFSKASTSRITLVEGHGVEGDAHFGVTVQHLSRVRRDPTQPNLRQVHLIHGELLDELAAAGHRVSPGELGENITTRGLDLLVLPVGARLLIADAVITLTGLRNPCHQINDFQDGLLKHVLTTDGDGTVTRLAGVMGVVDTGGTISPGDTISVELPTEHVPLAPV
jgi:MOSC domain-containing protein YiiM